jgi:ribosomal protein S18 acetylase RimI-like enzyme
LGFLVAEERAGPAGQGRRRAVVGAPETVRTRLEEVVHSYGAQEAIVVCITYEHEARRRTYELLASAFGLDPLDRAEAARESPPGVNGDGSRASVSTATTRKMSEAPPHKSTPLSAAGSVEPAALGAVPAVSDAAPAVGGAEPAARGAEPAVRRPDAGVRRARPEDVPALAAMLSRAFLDDPVASWAWRADELRAGALERFQAVRLRQLLGGQEIGTTDALTSAALWAAPGHWHMSMREVAMLAPCFMRARLFARMPLVALGWEKLERAHPRTPAHFYLAVLGTEPDAQGQGLGSAVLRPVLEQCDQDQVAAYLESSKERNVDFYARHGFRVLEEIRLLRGPKMWAMWREPRS